jgi:hypothetical protein
VGSVYHLGGKNTSASLHRRFFKTQRKNGNKVPPAASYRQAWAERYCNTLGSGELFSEARFFFYSDRKARRRPLKALKIKGFGSLKKERRVTKLKFIEIFSFLGLAF